jgi:hypothetical protein
MRGLLFLVLTATGLIVFLQNRQPVTLFFLGTSQQSALASLTLPLGLWVVLFATVGILTSLIINGLSRLGQPSQRRSPRDPLRSGPSPSVNPAPQRPEPEPRSPSPRYSAPEPEAIVNDDSEWDWDEPLPEITDWNGKPDPPSPAVPKISTPPRDSLQDRRRPSPTPRFASPSPESIADRPDQTSKPSFLRPDLEPEPERREPLPDLRQFEAPQTPTETKRQGTIYSQQYRPARSPAAKTPKTPTEAPAKPKTVYDAPYRVINPSSSPPSVNPENLDNGEEDEEWI